MKVECRAWTELAEVGLRIGLDEPGVESEVSKAIFESGKYYLSTYDASSDDFIPPSS